MEKETAVITIQKYIRAQSLEEAYQLNQNRQNRVIGGMLWLKTGKGNVNTAIDLWGLGLDTIQETEEQFILGAMVTLRQLELHQGLNAYTRGAAAAAVKDIVGVQFRNLATLGGSVWGRFGFSDVLTLFLAMDTYVELYQGGTVPLEQFVSMKYDNDILVRVLVKKSPLALVYRAMRNQRTDFPVIACALSRTEGEYRAVTGARPSRAMAVRDEQRILSAGLNEDSIRIFSEYVSEATPVGSNIRGSAAYRRHLIKVLTQRNLWELGGMGQWKSE